MIMTYSSENIKFKKANNINMQTNAFFETTKFYWHSSTPCTRRTKSEWEDYQIQERNKS